MYSAPEVFHWMNFHLAPEGEDFQWVQMQYTLIVSIKKIKISIQFLYLTNTADILI